MKKLLLSLGSVAAVAAPISAVIACSPKDTVDTYGISLNKAATTDFVVEVASGALTKTGGANIATANYFVPKGAASVKVLQSVKTSSTEAKYITLKLVTGTEVAANSTWKSEEGATTNITTRAATAKDFYVTRKIGTKVVPADAMLELKDAFNEEGKVVADTTTTTNASEATVASLNEILKDMNIMVDVATVSGTGANLKLDKLTIISFEAKSQKDIIAAFKKTKVEFGKGEDSSGSSIASAKLASNDEAGLKALLVADSGITNVTITDFPKIPSDKGTVVLEAEYTKQGKILVINVTVGTETSAPTANIVVTQAA